jgi:hypothetical protein
MTSPWMDSSEACEYLRFVNRATGKPRLKSLYAYLAAYGVTTMKRGRSLLIHRAELLATLEPWS